MHLRLSMQRKLEGFHSAVSAVLFNSFTGHTNQDNDAILSLKLPGFQIHCDPSHFKSLREVCCFYIAPFHNFYLRRLY
jgi:hypothetical protein